MPKRKVTDNLGIRQKALNQRVNEAFVNNVDFESINNTPEISEVDKLFKIDLASKQKNVEYILEILKSADSLYTTRALKKSLWLFDDDHTYIINREYLHKNIFPFTSLKMKRKILSHVALHIRYEDQAAKFYSYCVESKLMKTALKFLVHTSESVKLISLTDKKSPIIDLIVHKNASFLQNFLRKSFTLLKALLESIDGSQRREILLKKFQHWYNYDPSKYLDLVENYGRSRFDTKLSKMIMIEHKNRVLKKPKFYIDLLNRDILVKHSSSEDLKVYVVDLLPDRDFWFHNQYSDFKYFLELIPHEEIYEFLKKICNERYPNKEFETNRKFYDLNYYRFMTKDQQEAWAWEHIKSDKQILGVGRDYIWYGFVNFKDAFEEIKNLIVVTKDVEKRNEMLETLVKSAKCNSELETLFCYYHQKHLNEPRLYKCRFLNKVIIDEHNVFEFNDSCWKAFYTLLLSMDIYNTMDYDDNVNVGFKTVVFLYNIVHENEVPEQLNQFALKDFEVRNIVDHMKNLTQSKRDILYEYLYSMYMNKIIEYKYTPMGKTEETQIKKYFNNVVLLMKIYHEKSTPVKKYIHRREPKKRYRNRSLSDRELVRRLKEDSHYVLEALPEVATQFEARPFKINTFLKKVKLYFPDEISKSYFELFENNLSKDVYKGSIEASVNGLFELGDDNFKINFMNDNAPTVDKVEYGKVDPHKLRIQQAICKNFCRSRPPVPLANIQMYLKGDYVKYCLHVFDVFHANLSLPLCLNFVEAMLDTPVSVQKHGIRLAFKCFDAMNLKNLIIRTWQKNKNVSLRAVIYKALFKKLQDDCETELFEVLKTFTLELGPDDAVELFNLLVSNQLADAFLGDYNEAAWKAVGKFKDKEPNIQRKKYILQSIQNTLPLMREEFVRDVILRFLEEIFAEKSIRIMYDDQHVLQKLIKTKWNLVIAFLIHTSSNSKTPVAYVHLSTYITQVCIESWSEKHCEKLIYQDLCFDFIRDLRVESIKQTNCNPIDSIPFFETILNELKSKLPLPEIYAAFWDLNLTIILKRVTEEKPIDADSCVKYGKEVGDLIIRMVKDGTYFSHMAATVIKDEIQSHVDDLRVEIKKCSVKISSYACLVKFASGLVEHKSTETYVVAIEILPDDYQEWDSYKNIISVLSQMNDPNVQCAMHYKLRKNTSRN